jgi:cytochrome c-type biogenesis protein CcmE
MSRLDDELSEAVQEAEAEAEAVAVAAPVAPAVQSHVKRRNVGLLLGVLAIGAGALMLTLSSFDDSGAWSRKVDEFLVDKEAMNGRTVRVSGILVKGSLKKRDEPCEYRFELAGKNETLPVRYAGCVVPDTFRDVPGMDVEVTAPGKLNPAGYFEASEIMAKCPSKYEMQQRAKKGEQAPHSPTVPASTIEKF